MKLLVLATVPVTPALVREAVGDADPSGVEVLVVAPAVHDSALRFWMSDADEAIERATATEERTTETLRDAGFAAEGEPGEADPVVAATDALATFAADRLLVVTARDSDGYRANGDLAEEIRKRVSIPVSARKL